MNASRIDTHHHWLGLMIFMEAHRRLLHGQFGRIPEPVTVWAWAEGGYCIDAPMTLPAGGCFYLDLQPFREDEPNGLPEQLTVEREA